MKWLIYWSFMLLGLGVYSQDHSQCSKTSLEKVFPELSFSDNSVDFEKSVKIASGAFCELKDVKIIIKRKGIRTMMAARPKGNFLFKSKKNREYVIIISDRNDMNAEWLFNNMSTCAKVGVLGHELSHILSYTQMSNIELVWFGIKYVFRKKEIEAETDMMAIEKGFGEHIIEFNHHLHKSPRTNKKYLKRKKKYYLSSAEIEQELLDRL